MDGLRCGRIGVKCSLVDLADDPAVCQYDGQERSYKPQNPAASAPQIPEGRVLDENIGAIGCGVEDIGERRKNDKRQNGRPHKRFAKMRPRGNNPDGHDGGENKVIDDAAEFPVKDGVVEDSAQIRRLRIRGRLRCVHVLRSVVK
jgi:hypothetical protein